MSEPTPRVEPDQLCLALAMSQNGVISYAQARDRGLSRDAIHRRVHSGSWIKLLPRVYSIAGVPPSWLREVTAASLWIGSKGVVAGRAAGALWRLDGCPEGAIELLTTGAAKAPNSMIRVRHTRVLSQADRTLHRGLPVTAPARTLLDLATVVSHEELELAVEDALRRGLSSEARLRWMLDREWRNLPGAKALRTLLVRKPGRVTDSALEVKLFALLRRSGVELPGRQVEIYEGDRFIARVDLGYRDQRLAIEAHSYRFHSGRGAWERDVQRDKAIRRAGWRIIYVTHEDLTQRSTQVLRDIRSGLGGSGLFP